MATTQELETALVNADKAGDVDAAKALASELTRVRQAPPKMQIVSGPESFANAVKEEAKGMGTLSKVAIGVSGAVNDAAMRLKQMLGRDLTPEEVQGVQAQRALRDDSGAALTGNVVGNLAMTAAPGMAAERALGAVAGRVLPKILAPTAAAAGTGAGISAATTPLLGNETALDAAKAGAIGGAVGNTVARGLSRVARPITPSAEAQALIKEGIIPTPGRSAGADTFAGRFEQRLESIPLVGDIIRKGNTRAIEELNRAAINGTLPGGARTALVGRRAIDEAKVTFDDAYEKALTRKKVSIAATDLDKASAAVKSDPDVFIPPEMEKSLDKLVAQVKARIPASGELTGEMAKKIDSFLGRTAAQYNTRGGAAERDLGNAILGVQKEVRSAMAQTIPELRSIDSHYASFLRVQRAAGATGSKQGIFSPEALQSAVRQMDSGKAFSRGDAVMQNLSEPALNVLGRTVPDSGTAGRVAAMALMGGAAGGNEYLGGPGFITAAALSPLLYSRAGARYMGGNLIPGQQRAGDALLNLAPLASQIGRAINQ